MIKKNIRVVLLAFLISLISFNLPVFSSNTTSSDEFKSDLDLLVNMGIMENGYINSSQLQKTVTVEKAGEMLLKLKHIEPNKGQSPIDKLKETGLFKIGDFNNYERPITRAEFIMLLMRTADENTNAYKYF